MKQTLFFLLIILSQLSYSQTDINTAFNLKNNNFGTNSDIEIAPDTLIDLNYNYIEGFKLIDNEKQVIFQAKVFQNANGSAVLAETNFSEDMQCGFYSTDFYIIPALQQGKIYKSNREYFPPFTVNDFLIHSKVPLILTKYMFENNTITSVYSLENEIYSIKYILSQEDDCIYVTLNVCDYLAQNEISFSEKDWKIIESDFDILKFRYDNTARRFVLDIVQ